MPLSGRNKGTSCFYPQVTKVDDMSDHAYDDVEQYRQPYKPHVPKCNDVPRAVETYQHQAHHVTRKVTLPYDHEYALAEKHQRQGPAFKASFNSAMFSDKATSKATAEKNQHACIPYKFPGGNATVEKNQHSGNATAGANQHFAVDVPSAAHNPKLHPKLQNQAGSQNKMHPGYPLGTAYNQSCCEHEGYCPCCEHGAAPDDRVAAPAGVGVSISTASHNKHPRREAEQRTKNVPVNANWQLAQEEQY